MQNLEFPVSLSKNRTENKTISEFLNNECRSFSSPSLEELQVSKARNDSAIMCSTGIVEIVSDAAYVAVY